MTRSPLHLGPISKPLLADAVRDQLLESVISGELAPGQRLHIDELASAFGVSRTPVREALAQLEHARIVEISRNSSTVVASWGPEDMRIRARLLAGMARTAVLNPSEPGLKGLVPAIGFTPKGFVDACTFLIEALGSPIATRMGTDLAAPLRLFLAPSTLRRHGLASHRMQLETPLRHLDDALVKGNRWHAVQALDELVVDFLAGLIGAHPGTPKQGRHEEVRPTSLTPSP